MLFAIVEELLFLLVRSETPLSVPDAFAVLDEFPKKFFPGKTISPFS
jgi:hypothetical protein